MATTKTTVTQYRLTHFKIDDDTNLLSIEGKDESGGSVTFLIRKTDVLQGTHVFILPADEAAPSEYFTVDDSGPSAVIKLYLKEARLADQNGWIGYGKPFPYTEVTYHHNRFRIRMPAGPGAADMPDIFFERIQIGIKVHLIAAADETVTILKNGRIELRGTDDLLRSIREGTMPEATD